MTGTCRAGSVTRIVLSAGVLPGLCLSAMTPALAEDTAILPPGVGMLEHPCPALPDDLPPVLAEPNNLPKDDPGFAGRYAAVRKYRLSNDWPGLCRFQAENASAVKRGRPLAVFMGDSITEAWIRYDPAFFGNRFADRGISGQTSPQMLLRFYQDVVSIHPRVVHIMSGTNDIAGNTGPTTIIAYQNNIRAMVDIARANGIRVVLGSIPPTIFFPWRPEIRPAEQVARLNSWLKAFAQENRIVYADYHTAMSLPDGSMRPEYTFDGTHPGTSGYKVMSDIAEKSIAMALKQQHPH